MSTRASTAKTNSYSKRQETSRQPVCNAASAPPRWAPMTRSVQHAAASSRGTRGKGQFHQDLGFGGLHNQTIPDEPRPDVIVRQDAAPREQPLPIFPGEVVEFAKLPPGILGVPCD